MARPIAFVDTETTSLAPDREAWEIAIVRREPDGREKSWEAFVEVDIRRADPASLRIGGYYGRHPFGVHATGATPTRDYNAVAGPSFAAGRVAAFTHDATIVGACPWFDTHTLERLLRDNGFLPAWHYRLRDVEAMAAGFIGDMDLGGLAACARAVGVEVDPEREHTAMGDVFTAMRVYDAVRLHEALGS